MPRLASIKNPRPEMTVEAIDDDGRSEFLGRANRARRGKLTGSMSLRTLLRRTMTTTRPRLPIPETNVSTEVCLRPGISDSRVAGLVPPPARSATASSAGVGTTPASRSTTVLERILVSTQGAFTIPPECGESRNSGWFGHVLGFLPGSRWSSLIRGHADLLTRTRAWHPSAPAGSVDLIEDRTKSIPRSRSLEAIGWVEFDGSQTKPMTRVEGVEAVGQGRFADFRSNPLTRGVVLEVVGEGEFAGFRTKPMTCAERLEAIGWVELTGSQTKPMTRVGRLEAIGWVELTGSRTKPMTHAERLEGVGQGESADSGTKPMTRGGWAGLWVLDAGPRLDLRRVDLAFEALEAAGPEAAGDLAADAVALADRLE